MPVVARLIVYPIFAAFMFFIFFVFLFPFESIKGRIETQVEQGLGGNYQVEIGDLSPALFTGISLDKVVVGEKKQQGAPVLTLDHATLRFDILPFLWGDMRFRFNIDSKGGEMDGKVSVADERMRIESEIDAFDLALFPIIVAKSGLVVKSNIEGKVDVEVYPKSPLRNNGSIQLKIHALQLEKSNLMGVLSLPAMEWAGKGSPSRVDVVMNRGNIEVRAFTLQGKDADLNLGGKVYLAQRIDNFRFNLRGKLGIAETVSVDLPFLMIVEKQKGPDGKYPMTITGQLGNPSVRVGDFRLPL